MSLSLAALFFTVTSTVCAGCGPKHVVIDGVEMPYEDAATKIYEEGRRAQAAGDIATAKIRWKEIVDSYADSDRLPDALSDLGALFFDEGGCRASRVYDERLAVKFPLHAKAAAAKERLTGCEGMPAGASESLSTFYVEFNKASTPAEKKEVASKGVDSAVAGGDFAGAVRWLLELVELEDAPAQKAAHQAEAVDLVDRRVGFRDVRALLDEKGGGFLAPVLTYKLGRIQYHVRDFENARETLKSYLEKWPQGDYQKGAEELLALIDARSKVNPKSVGVVLPLSGKYRKYGEYALQALQYGLGEKGQNPANVTLVVKDTKSDGVIAAQAVQDLVYQDGVIAIVGPIFPKGAEPAAYKAQQLGVPLLTISGAPEIGDIGPYVFRNALTNKAQAEALVKYAMDIEGMKTFAILYPRHPYGEEFLHLFWDEVEKRKGEIRGVESYGTEDTTFSSQVKRLVARDALDIRRDYREAIRECDKQPDSYRQARCKERARKDLKPIVDFDGLFIPDYPRAISMISAALAFEDIIVEKNPRRLKIIEKTLDRKVTPVTLLGTSGWNSEKLLETAGRNVENAIFADGFFAGADDKATAEFVSGFAKKHQRVPQLIPEALFFDSIRVIKSVIEKEQPASREAMRAALRRVHDFPGVTGKTSFVESPDATKSVKIMTIKEGKIEEIPPPDAKPAQQQAP